MRLAQNEEFIHSRTVNRLLLVVSCLVTLAAHAQVIPLPLDDRARPGELLLAGETMVAAPPDSTELYLETLRQAGIAARPVPADARAAIQFLAQNMLPDDYPIPAGEGYVIRITPQVINVHAASPAGHFYGLQTLAQLIESARNGDGKSVRLACRDIVDSPRFAWRGFMLDESRHFTGPVGVKRLIDAMARFKLNRLHWHLTDSPAWRIEIKKYPELTRIGGRGSETDRSPDAPANYYTQAQIREIVAYAKQRAVTIIPEIDMPGHADATVTAYPEHDGGGFIQKGNPLKWPRFTFNPAKQETLTFLDDILTEVAALFPDAGVIHFGGDEVHFGWQKWTSLPEVQALMKKENLKDLAAVETWFNRRMAGTINRLGFKTGGWDEIAARDLPPDKTIVWWWRHDKPEVLKQALAAGYPVILTPRRPCYFDFVQHDSHQTGRRWGGFNPLADVYQFPASLKLSAADEAKILGIQACLWTEATITQARRDFMTWPRLIALAESAWTAAKHKDFNSFETRLKPQLAWLQSKGIGFYDPFTHSPEISDQGAKTEYLDTPE
jgi:hexosaminidase